MKKRDRLKKGQVTIFVIIALLLIVGIAGYFIVKDRFFLANVPADIAPVYEYYSSCVKTVLEDGAAILGSRAGYIESPEFKPGSQYAPFSSELDFMGTGVPYWYYISANGVAKEQIPSEKQMEDSLNKYVAEEIGKCGLDAFESQGYVIELGQAKAKTDIQQKKISARISQRIKISKGESNFVISNYNLETDSRLGEFYGLAKKIYNYEKNSAFLENYSVDVLYTYAPVSGAEISCSPVIWNPYEVISKLKKALEANMQAIKISGDYYENTNPYFIANKGSDLQVKNAQIGFLYSGDWASRFEVWPTKNNLMIANPVGTQPGLAAMGFCYASYKFVYDMYFPVLVQIYGADGLEVFQFPFAVVISKNVPRQASETEALPEVETICDKANTNITVSTYNVNLGPVEANLKFRCLTSSCNLGRTRINNESNVASLEVAVPQCLNGILIASSNGYKEKRYVISTNEETSADIVLDREYELGLEVYVDNSLTGETAVLNIWQNDGNQSNLIDTIAYPFTKKIKISQGNYKFELKVYKAGKVVIPETTTRQCVNLPKSGVLGLIGVEDEKCSDITIPSQELTSVIYAGGSINQYMTESELQNGGAFRVYANSVKLPSSLEEIESSYDKIESKTLDIGVA